VYVFIGATTPWTDDSTPPVPSDSVDIQADSYRSMMSLKKIASTDVKLAIPHFAWTSGNIYSQYTQLADMFNPVPGTPPFYAVTSDLKVYVCLFNNGGATSTVVPSGTSTLPFTTSDSYTWKYMYTVSSSDALKFVTPQWIPIQTLLSDDGSPQWAVQQAAVPGAIDRIDMVTVGSSYSTPPSVAIVGDGINAAATAHIAGGNVTGITVTNTGSGYTYANVVITGGGIGANGAAAQAIVAPQAGHGADAVAELGGRFVLINPKLIYDESGTFTVTNDYRRIGLVLNPLLWGTSTKATGNSYTQSTVLTFSTVTGSTFTPDEVVTGLTSLASGVVLDFDSNNKVLRLVQTSGTFRAGELVQNVATTCTGTLSTYAATALNGTSTTIVLPSGASSVNSAYNGMTITLTSGTGAGQTKTILSYVGSTRTATVSTWTTTPDSSSGFVIANIQNPAIQPFSGKVIYVENRRPLSRSNDQSEDLKMIVEF